MTVVATSKPLKPSHLATVLLDSLWPLRLEQYHQMIDAGILSADDPVELLQGFLVRTEPKSPAHSTATRLTRQALERLIPSGWDVVSHEPITMTDSEPEPDVFVTRGDTRQYLDRHPGPQEVGLVIEVAKASLDRDRILKKHLYAEAAIPIYWIVNLQENQVEVYSDPTGPAEEPDYRQRQVYKPGDDIILHLAGQELGRIPVQDMLPGMSEPRP